MTQDTSRAGTQKKPKSGSEKTEDETYKVSEYTVAEIESLRLTLDKRGSAEKNDKDASAD